MALTLNWNSRVRASLLALAGTAGMLLTGAAQHAAALELQTNMHYVEELTAKAPFEISDQKAVLKFVIDNLPSTVTVYPTENYFYFGFYHGGVRYAGNLRFDIADRDKGLVHFNYFKDFTPWQRDEKDFGDLLGSKDGVTLKKIGPLAYDLSYGGKTIRFNLNDMSGVKPPAGLVQKNETYIGPVFDESGIRFFLVFNRDLKIFHYLLDETVTVADQFEPVDNADRITLGVRTGFALYDDRFAKRKILVGVAQANTSVNNYLDGPFDQLPDNFIEGDVLKDAILAATPEMAGQIDRLGNSPDGQTRYLIAPYMNFEDPSELEMIAQCGADEDLPVYYNCFSFADTGGAPEDGEMPPEGEDAPPEDGDQQQ